MAESPLEPYRSRRTHRKSRNGCKNCKSRKIKCDEAKPQCWQCSKHNIACDFSKENPLPTTSLSAGTTPNTTAMGSSALPSPGTPPETPQSSLNDHSHWQNRLPLPPFTQGQEDMALLSDDLDLKLHMTDLELLHHFTVSTALTLSTIPELQTWWRIDVPNLAFSHPFVMRALLALSGMHLAHGLLAPGPSASYFHFKSAFTTEEPSPADLHHIAQSHISRALAQHTIALRTAHRLLPTTTPETCAPLYVCAVLCMLVAFTTPRGAGPCSEHPPLLFVTSDGAAGPAPWLHLSRGIKAIIEQSRDSMLMTHIGVPLRMALSPRNQTAPGPADVDDTAAAAAAAAAAAESGSEAVRALVALRGWLDEEGDICFADAAESLVEVYQTFDIAGDAIVMRAVLGWVCHVDEAFLRALAERDCRALVVFAYYAVLLHWLDSGNWWINGWGRHVVTKIDAMVDAEDCQGWLRWPREQVGVWKEDHQPVDCVVI